MRSLLFNACHMRCEPENAMEWTDVTGKSKYVSTVTSPGNPSYLWSLIRKHKTEVYRLFVCTRERKRLNHQKKVLGNKISQSTQFLSRFPRQFQVRIHKESIEGAFSFLVWAAEVPSGGACTVIGRTHSHLSLPSIKRGCSNLNRNNPELLRIQIRTKSTVPTFWAGPVKSYVVWW